MYIIELVHCISLRYLSEHQQFPNDGKITSEFVAQIENLVTEYYVEQHNEGKRHLVKFDMVERCRDLITGNIEQYKLLMYLTPEERFTETQSSSTAPNCSIQQLDGNLSKKQKRFVRLQPRMTEVMSRVLLFRSLIFTSTSLYADRVVKRTASILGAALAKLVEMELLIVLKKGFFSSKWTPIYIKKLPDTTSLDDQMKYQLKLSELGIPDLNLENVQDASNQIIIEGKGKISSELLDILQRPEYQQLHLDTSVLVDHYGESTVPFRHGLNFCI